MIYKSYFTIRAIVIMVTTVLVDSLAIRNSYDFNRYNHYQTTYPTINPTTTMSPPMERLPPYANSFSNPTSLTSFFSPDRYSHLNTFLSPNLGGIKLIPPALTNHLYQKFPLTTKFPTTVYQTTMYPTTPGPSSPSTTTPSTNRPVTTQASFESTDVSSPVIIRPKKPTIRPITSHLYESSAIGIDTGTSSSTRPPTGPPLYHQDHIVTAGPANRPVVDDSATGSLGLLYVCKFFVTKSTDLN